MTHRKTERNPLFAGRWFEDDIILLCLRWYFRFKLSYRDLVEILGERGLPISHTPILRWVVRYAEICERRWSRFERPVGGSWRVDETFIKVRGQWMYLYRAVDGQGNTVEFCLSRTRGIAAAVDLPEAVHLAAGRTGTAGAAAGRAWMIPAPRAPRP